VSGQLHALAVLVRFTQHFYALCTKEHTNLRLKVYLPCTATRPFSTNNWLAVISPPQMTDDTELQPSNAMQ